MKQSLTISDERQMAILSSMASDPQDTQLAKRASIVLGLAAGKSVREIASEVGLNKDAVTRWKKRYSEGGINALYSEHGGGPSPSLDSMDLQGRIRGVMDANPDETWTRQSLSEVLGVPESKINKELGKMHLNLSRKTSWCFPTADELQSRCMCIAGLYLSAKSRCIVLCTSSSDLTPGEEVFITRNRLLAESLENCNTTLTLRDVIWTASDHVGESGKKKHTKMSEFLDSVLDGIENPDRVSCYVIGMSDEPIRYRGQKPINLIYQAAEDIATWTDHVRNILCELTSPVEQMKANEILRSIRHFTEECKPKTEPLIWRKTVSVSEGTTVHSEDIQSEAENEPRFLSADEAMSSLLSAIPASDTGMDVFMIPVIRDKQGIHFTIVQGPQSFPGADAFDFSSSEGFMNGFNKMEEPMILLRNEAGKQATTLYMDAVKKQHDGGDQPVFVESNLGRLQLPDTCSASLRKGNALLRNCREINCIS